MIDFDVVDTYPTNDPVFSVLLRFAQENPRNFEKAFIKYHCVDEEYLSQHTREFESFKIDILNVIMLTKLGRQANEDDVYRLEFMLDNLDENYEPTFTYQEYLTASYF